MRKEALRAKNYVLLNCDFFLVLLIEQQSWNSSILKKDLKNFRILAFMIELQSLNCSESNRTQFRDSWRAFCDVDRSWDTVLAEKAVTMCQHTSTEM